MRGMRTESRIQDRLIDVLYVDAMVLADEARSYFDEGGRADREALDPMARLDRTVINCMRPNDIEKAVTFSARLT